MEKTYQPESIETRWYQYWESQGYFAASGQGEPYCIVIPPPNVTGSLHMGHAFQQTLMDALIRYHRMRGDNTLWQAGTDHAGIATQMVVERLLAAEDQTDTNSVARPLSNGFGTGKSNPAIRLPASSVDLAPRSIGRANASHGRRPVRGGERGLRQAL